MNDFLYDSFGSSDLVDPFLEEEEKNKKREDSGSNRQNRSRLTWTRQPPRNLPFLNLVLI